MSANAESQTPQQPGSKKGKRKGALLLLTLLFIIVAVAYGIYWFLVLRAKRRSAGHPRPDRCPAGV